MLEIVAPRPPLASRLWLTAGVLTIAATLATQVDLPLARWVRAEIADGGLKGDLARIVELSEAFAFGGTAVLIILAAVVLDLRGWRVAPRLAICTYVSGFLADIGKTLVGRWRPLHANLDGEMHETFVSWLPNLNAERLSELGIVPGYKLRSFPSGHTTTAFGLAIGLSLLYPRGRWLFFAIAALSAYQRIDSESHFLSDVLAGAALAFVVGAITEGGNPLGRWLNKIEGSATVRMQGK